MPFNCWPALTRNLIFDTPLFSAVWVRQVLQEIGHPKKTAHANGMF